MGFEGLIDRENLVCSFCGAKPVVGLTFEIDVDAEVISGDEALVENSIIATCKGHLSILQEQFDKEVGSTFRVGEIGGDTDA